MKLTKALLKLINQFGICMSCGEQTAYRNESYYCDSCSTENYVDDFVDTDVMFGKMECVVKELAKHYQKDSKFWEILLHTFDNETPKIDI